MVYSCFSMEPSWLRVLEHEFSEPYLASLAAFVARERNLGVPVYPPEELVFNAFWQTPYSDAKVLIMGQDPYHGPGQAHGLSFSVPEGVALPPSLQNIFKELEQDMGCKKPPHGCLLSWARQGVLLLNATLTVRQGEPMSHSGKGWERFTDQVVSALSKKKDPVIFVLWGKFAQEKCLRLKELADNKRHLILKAPHPSPLSAHQGFIGCRHFSQINEFLTKIGSSQIDWNLNVPRSG